MNKDELADRICDVLGLELDSLTRMSKSDLEALVKFLDDPSNLIRTGVKMLREKARGQITKPLKELLDRPLIEILREGEDKGGLLGFGIIPSILKRRGVSD